VENLENDLQLENDLSIATDLQCNIIEQTTGTIVKVQLYKPCQTLALTIYLPERT